MSSALAWRNLLHQKARSVAAVTGLAFPIMLVFVQLGLSEVVLKSATQIYDALDFDVVIVSPSYVALWKAGRFPRSRLQQALSVQGVRAVAPLYVGFLPWRNAATGTRRDILVLGCDPRHHVFRLPEVRELAPELQQQDAVLLDRVTRPEFGPLATGMLGEVGGRRVTVAGQYTLGAGFLADGTLIGSDETFVRLFRLYGIDEVSVGLVQLIGGSDSEQVAGNLRRWLPADVRVWTRPALERHEREYWNRSTSVGVIFGVGVTLGFAVLGIIVYQLLSTDITKRLREYATMKAMGYGPGHLSWVVVQQALILVGVASLVGLVLALFTYRLLEDATHLAVRMTALRIVAVLTLSVALGAASSFFALHRLRSADPADLF